MLGFSEPSAVMNHFTKKQKVLVILFNISLYLASYNNFNTIKHYGNFFARPFDTEELPKKSTNRSAESDYADFG